MKKSMLIDKVIFDRYRLCRHSPGCPCVGKKGNGVPIAAGWRSMDDTFQVDCIHCGAISIIPGEIGYDLGLYTECAGRR